MSGISALSAVTLHVADMGRSFGFYEAIGFEVHYGNRAADFSSFHVGTASYLNLQFVGDPMAIPWGRVILHVDDVDALHARCLTVGLVPEAAPVDAPWGERYFHLRDPDGHELSFARYL